MNKIEQLKSAITLLENQDIDALKKALSLVGEPVTENDSAPVEANGW